MGIIRGLKPWCLDQDMSALMTALIDSIMDVVSAQSTWPMLVRSPDDIGHQCAQIAILKNHPFFCVVDHLANIPTFCSLNRSKGMQIFHIWDSLWLVGSDM